MLQKGVYPYRYINNWEKFNEILLPEKEEFYIHFNMEDITDADCAHAKRVCKDFKTRNLGDYHDLHVQSDIFVSRFVWNFWKMCLEIYEFDSPHFLSTSGLAWQEALKRPN